MEEGVVCAYSAVTTRHRVQLQSATPSSSTSPTEVWIDFSSDNVASCEPRVDSR